LILKQNTIEISISSLPFPPQHDDISVAGFITAAVHHAYVALMDLLPLKPEAKWHLLAAAIRFAA
jgi:hypothetical protein